MAHYIVDTMKKRGGICTKGSTEGKVLPSSQNICDRWPNQHTSLRLTDVLLVGKGMHRVNQKEQLS